MKHALFIALKGERFDAHDFLESAIEKGAAALLVARIPPRALELARGKGTAVLRARGTMAAMTRLASRQRELTGARVVGAGGGGSAGGGVMRRSRNCRRQEAVEGIPVEQVGQGAKVFDEVVVMLTHLVEEGMHGLEIGSGDGSAEPFDKRSRDRAQGSGCLLYTSPSPRRS